MRIWALKMMRCISFSSARNSFQPGPRNRKAPQILNVVFKYYLNISQFSHSFHSLDRVLGLLLHLLPLSVHIAHARKARTSRDRSLRRSLGGANVFTFSLNADYGPSLSHLLCSIRSNLLHRGMCYFHHRIGMLRKVQGGCVWAAHWSWGTGHDGVFFLFTTSHEWNRMEEDILGFHSN